MENGSEIFETIYNLIRGECETDEIRETIKKSIDESIDVYSSLIRGNHT